MSPTKSEIRKNILRRRTKQSFEERKNKSEQICKTLFERISTFFPKGANILFYAPQDSEVDILPLHSLLSETEQYICCFPKITDTKNSIFEAVKTQDIDDLECSNPAFAIKEPKSNQYESPESLDLILVPSVAIDISGNRVGHGQGFYDRFLKRILPTCQKWAPIFSFQKVEKIKVDSYDVPVGVAVDETGFFLFS